MKNNIFALSILFSGFAYAQTGGVGINTDAPKTTLDVSVNRDTNGALTEATGLKSPNLTLEELTAREALYTQAHLGTILYISDVSGGNTNASRTNVSQAGYYLLTKDTNQNLIWQRIFASGDYANIYIKDGEISDNRIVTQGANSLTFSSTDTGKTIFKNTEATADNQKTPLKIIDGAQAAGKALTSDANGVATWKPYGAKSVTGSTISGTLGGTTTTSTDLGLDKVYVVGTSSILLPPGKWLVIMGNTYDNIKYALPGGTLANGGGAMYASGFTLTYFLSDDNTAGATSIQDNITQDVEGDPGNKSPLLSAVLPLYQEFTYAFGQQTVNNTSGAPKRYYLKKIVDSNSFFTTGPAKPNRISVRTFGGAEKIFYAIKMTDIQ